MNATHKLMLRTLIVAAAILPGIFRAESAQATVRVHARIHTPNLKVEIGPRPVRHLPRATVVVREKARWNDGCVVRSDARVSVYDREVAGRLSRMSGVSRRAILRAKARGLSWDQIGREFHISRPMLRAALDPLATAQYLQSHPPRGRGHHGRR